MNNVYLKELEIINFKGIRNLKMEFSEYVNTIYGDNGQGKTTIADAIFWVLFGKNTKQEADFGIKTLDPATGAPYPKVEHSVKIKLSCNGQEKTFKRKFSEVWSKPTEEKEEKLTAHKTEFYINDVKVPTKKAYDEEVASIIPYDIFRTLTDCKYFFNLSAEQQKSLLFEMVGVVSDEDVVKLSPKEFAKFLEEIKGTTIANYKAKISAQNSAIKEVLKVIPAQIEVLDNTKPTLEESIDQLQEQEKSINESIANIDAQLTDASKIVSANLNRKIDIQKSINEKKSCLQKRESDISLSANESRNKSLREIQDLKLSATAKEIQLKKKRAEKDSIDKSIEESTQKLEELRSEYREIAQEQLQIDENAFVCPTCKRSLEAEDIFNKQAEIEQNFNKSKSDRLKENQEKGKNKSKELQCLQLQSSNLALEIQKLHDELESIKIGIEAKENAIPESLDVVPLFSSDETCIRLTNEIKELENQAQSINVSSTDDSELKAEKSRLEEYRKKILVKLEEHNSAKRIEAEIEKLYKSQKANNEALAELEGKENVAFRFQKEKENLQLQKINSLFKYVKFSFVTEQLNGGEKMDCICLVDGVPYKDANLAGQVNAGIDVINALSSYHELSTMLILDNRESVTSIIATDAQVINMIVKNSEELNIK